MGLTNSKNSIHKHIKYNLYKKDMVNKIFEQREISVKSSICYIKKRYIDSHPDEKELTIDFYDIDVIIDEVEELFGDDDLDIKIRILKVLEDEDYEAEDPQYVRDIYFVNDNYESLFHIENESVIESKKEVGMVINIDML